VYTFLRAVAVRTCQSMCHEPPRFTCIVGVALALSVSSTAWAAERTILVLDVSGSMWGQISGETKMSIAQETLADVLSTIPETIELGFMAYGHRRKSDCSDIELMTPPGPGTGSAIIAAAKGLTPLGKTPLSEAARLAASDLGYTEEKATVILITDGIETCAADPCALAAELERNGVDFTVHVVGFGLSEEEGRQVACLAENTGGRYFSAADASGLADALTETIAETETPAPAPAPEPGPAPEPSPAPPPDYLLEAVVYLAEGIPYEGEIGVWWELGKLGGAADEPPVLSTSTLSNVLTQNPEPGTYVVRAKVDLASGEEPVEVTAGAEAEARIVLKAGTVRAVAIAGEGKDIPNDVANRVRIDLSNASGKTTGKNGWGFFGVVPAGQWVLKAVLGNAAVELPLDVAAGESKEIDVVLPVGLLVLRGKEPGNANPLEGVQWRVTGPDGQDVFCERYFTEIDCTVSAGAYAVTATYGDIVVNEAVEVPAGERVVRELTLE
jgi:Ca-activated chloride channel homolog